MATADLLTPTANTYRDAVVLPVVELGDHERLFLNSPYYRYLGGVCCRGQGVAEALHVRAAEIVEPADRPADGARHGELQAPSIPASARSGGRHVYCGRAFPHLGHFVCEGLSRIWYARRHPDATLVWTGAAEYTPLQQEILALLGIRNPALFVREPTLIESLVVPSQGHIMPTFYAPYFLDSIAVLEPAPIVAGKKTYVSRVNTPGGRYINEAAVEAMLHDAGWSILHPEQLPFAERFDALSSSEVILTVEGAAITSLLFFRELHSRLFTLTRNISGLTGYDVAFREYFGAIARDKGWQYRRLDLPKRWVGGQRTGAQFELDLDAFGGLMQATDFLSRNARATDALHKAYLRARDHDIGIAAAAVNAVTTEVDAVTARVYRAGLHELAGALDRAAEEVREALRIRPRSVYLLVRLADLLRQQSDPAGARDALLQALQASKDDSYEPHVRLAELHQELGNPRGAINEARRAVELMPATPELRLFLGGLLLSDNALDEARVELEHALALDSRLGSAHIQLSHVHARCGALDEAIAQARAAIARDEAHPGYRVHLGQLLARQGELSAAAAAVHDALSLAPNYEWAMNTLSSINEQQREGAARAEAFPFNTALGGILQRARSRLRRWFFDAGRG